MERARAVGKRGWGTAEINIDSQSESARPKSPAYWLIFINRGYCKSSPQQLTSYLPELLPQSASVDPVSLTPTPK